MKWPKDWVVVSSRPGLGPGSAPEGDVASGRSRDLSKPLSVSFLGWLGDEAREVLRPMGGKLANVCPKRVLGARPPS